MKRFYVAMAVVLTIAGLSYWAVAADIAPAAKEPMMQKGMMNDGMMGAEMREHMGGMCPGHMMMGKMMTTSQMVATSDGGVVVMVGTTLTKYDKDLTMIKEVQMKVDVDAMMKKMQDMCAKCPMCKAMKDGQKMEMEKMGTEKMKEGMKGMMDMKTETK